MNVETVPVFSSDDEEVSLAGGCGSGWAARTRERRCRRAGPFRTAKLAPAAQ
jgi:hypothetical protein